MLNPIMTFILQYYYRFFYFGEERGPCQAPNRHDIINLYSQRQKKLDTSLNRRKMKSNKDRIDFKIGNKAEIYYNYFGVHNMMIGHL